MKWFSKNFALPVFLILGVLSLIVVFAFKIPVGTLSFTNSALAAVAAPLLTANGFGVLSSTYTNTVPGTTINGNIGYTTGPAVAPVVSGTTNVADATYTQAGIDQGNALVALNAQVCDFNFGAPTDLSLLPQPLLPGVYCINGATSIGAGGITLDTNGVFIFRIVGALNTAANSSVSLSGGASACSVFWTPTGATTLGANSTFVGTNIDNAGITIGSTVGWTGRALAFGGTITTDGDTITVPICLLPLGGGGGGTYRMGGCTDPAATNFERYATYQSETDLCRYSLASPLIDVVKVPNPLALPDGPGRVEYTYTLRNIGTVPVTDVTMVDDTCSPVVFISGDTNNDAKLDVNETWVHTCSATLTKTHTNTIVATGRANGLTATDIAKATVVVGAPVVAPLIHVTKVPSTLTLPANGGLVTYTYTVTNPGAVPLSNVKIVDDKCTDLPGRVLGHPGDLNKNDLLENNEAWLFTCQTNLVKTTTNTVIASGKANGFTVRDFALATVVVAPPSLPNTGFPTDGKSTLWYVSAFSAIAVLGWGSFLALRKGKI